MSTKIIFAPVYTYYVHPSNPNNYYANPTDEPDPATAQFAPLTITLDTDTNVVTSTYTAGPPPGATTSTVTSTVLSDVAVRALLSAYGVA